MINVNDALKRAKQTIKKSAAVGSVDNSVPKEKRDNRLYIYRMQLDDGPLVYKVGVSCHPNMVDRLLEVLRAFYMRYRYIPMSDCLKYIKCENAYEVEAACHAKLKEFKYEFDKKFSGSTEMFVHDDEDWFVDFVQKQVYSYDAPPWLAE